MDRRHHTNRFTNVRTFNIAPDALTCKKGSICNVALSNYYVRNECKDWFEFKNRNKDNNNKTLKSLALGLLLALVIFIVYQIGKGLYNYFTAPKSRFEEDQDRGRVRRQQIQEQEEPKEQIFSGSGSTNMLMIVSDDDIKTFQRYISEYRTLISDGITERLSEELTNLGYTIDFLIPSIKNVQKNLFSFFLSPGFKVQNIPLELSKQQADEILVYKIVEDMLHYIWFKEQEEKTQDTVSRWIQNYFNTTKTPIRFRSAAPSIINA